MDPVEFVIDSGAHITVVPDKFVYTDQLLEECIWLIEATGVTVRAHLAKISVELFGTTFDRVVAIAHADSLCDRVLFSVTMPQYCMK